MRKNGKIKVTLFNLMAYVHGEILEILEKHEKIEVTWFSLTTYVQKNLLMTTYLLYKFVCYNIFGHLRSLHIITNKLNINK